MAPCRTMFPNAIPLLSQGPFLSWPLVLPVVSLLLGSSRAAAKQQCSQLYPSQDDYNPNILDAATIFGSPYGGFSRDTQSRLASLPLKLPDQVLSDDADAGQTLYWEIADGLGREYACRIFDQQEIEPESLDDSMFEPPGTRLNVEVQQTKYRVIGERVARVLGSKRLGHDEADKRDNEPQWPDDKDEVEDETMESLSVDQRVVDEFTVLRIEHKLDVLEGVCIQKLIGFSTYELCWEGKIHKFHVNVPPKESVYQKIHLEDVSVLGAYSHRKIIPNHGLSRGDDEIGPLGRIKQTFLNGDRCQETGQRMESVVNVRCCSADKTQSYSGATLLKGMPIPNNKLVLASLVNIWEDPDRPCCLMLDVCTPVLCAETAVYDIFERIDSLGIDDEDNEPDDLQYATTAAGIPPSTIEKLSVSDLLDHTLGDNCVYSSKQGWWTYE
jgi:hypothetical protein